MIHTADLIGPDAQGLWLNVFGDLDDRLWLRHSTMTRSVTSNSRVEAGFAGGGVRLIRQAGRVETYAVTLRRIGYTEEEWLVGRAGAQLVIRDHKGRRAVGAFLSVPFEDQERTVRAGKAVDWATTSATFQATHVGPLGPYDPLAGL